MQSNLAQLTHAHSVVAAKKRARREQLNQVLFDEDARREFLTGFHKRKLAKTQAAKQKAIQREKQERLETRRDHRRMLRERAKENAEQVEKAYGAVLIDVDEEWTGISSCKGKQKEEEYQDEEVLATVTVVEDFDPDSIIHGPPPSTSHPIEPTVPTPKVTRDKATSKKPPKPKKIKYETKAERNAEKTKQRRRRTEKAELAGGKAARKKGAGRKGPRR